MLRNDRDGDGVDSDPNTYGDAYANTYSDAYAITHAYAHPITITYAHTYTITYAHTYAIAYAYAHPITITYAHAHAIAYAHCPCQCHSNAIRKNIANAKTASHFGAASHTRRSDSCHVDFHAERHWRSYGCSS
jgi:hypothetical protein